MLRRIFRLTKNRDVVGKIKTNYELQNHTRSTNIVNYIKAQD